MLHQVGSLVSEESLVLDQGLLTLGHLALASVLVTQVERRVEGDQTPIQCEGQVLGDQGVASCGQAGPHCGQDTGWRQL